MSKAKYSYDNIEITPYWNGYRVWYRHENGNREQLGFQMTKWAAELLGRAQVDFMNGKSKN